MTTINPASRESWLRRLRFPPELERRFQHSYWIQYRTLLRGTTLLLVTLGLASAARDSDKGAAYVLAVHGVRVLALSLFGLTFARPAERYWQPAFVAAAGVAFTFMLGAAGDAARMVEGAVPPDARTLVLRLWGISALILALVTLAVVRLQFLWAALLQTGILAAGIWAGVTRLHLPAGSLLFAAAPLLLVLVLNLTSALTHERLQRGAFLAHCELAEERARSDELLRNVLPEAIAERLKAGEGPLADDHPAATVLFADLVEFTAWSAARPAREVLRFLNEVFSRFDRLVEAHGLEKLKTVGDSYVVVAGAPLPRADHVDAACRLALAMRAELQSLHSDPEGAPLRLRIGIHTGPLIAGVLGSRRFQYDVWGDTVNTASRLEAQGIAGAIQVSAEVAARLGEKFVLARRGEVEIKGKGLLTAYLLESERLAGEPVAGRTPRT